jgi:large subunit ribosomal protein L27
MAHKKAGGSTSLGRDSQAKRLGVKIHDGQAIEPGQIITRQRGTRVRPGVNVEKGTDDTLYAKKAGKVKFYTKKVLLFNGKLEARKFVKIV